MLRSCFLQDYYVCKYELSHENEAIHTHHYTTIMEMQEALRVDYRLRGTIWFHRLTIGFCVSSIRCDDDRQLTLITK